jgi:hypothetical protein
MLILRAKVTKRKAEIFRIIQNILLACKRLSGAKGYKKRTPLQVFVF